MAEFRLETVQAALYETDVDGWLFYDHHGRDPLAYRVLGLSPLHVSRRWFYWVPAKGEPRKLVHRIEAGRLDTLPGERSVYSSWQELEAGLERILAGARRVAMQYSPRNAIMAIGMVDAGTVELLRGWGKEVVSSADLIARFEAVLLPEQIASHYAAQKAIDRIVPEGWRWMRAELDAGRAVSEYSMQSRLREAMRREGLVWEHGPNVSVDANSADSHYEPEPEGSRAIREGSFLLLDIWGRLDEEKSIWYDITWTGTVGRAPSAREQEIFHAVRDARDAAIQLVKERFASGAAIAGWEADRAARTALESVGFGGQFTHRTGHNIGVEIHGAGAHLDDLETHDERRILPYTCFSVEPGVYLDGEFGVRSEVNMVTSETEAVVTGRVQTELVRI